MVGRPRQPGWSGARWGILVALVTLLAGIGLVGASAAARGKRARPARRTALRFGIYPGGGAGTIGAGAALRPEDPAQRLAALEQLAGGHPFVLHLYVNYTGPTGSSAAQQADEQGIAQYAAAGFDVELVLCYRPNDHGSSQQAHGFARFVRDAVSSLADNPRLVSLQVTNEANAAGAANATDGYYAHAKDALITGVIAAKHEARALGRAGLAVGFNWAYATDPGQSDFWRYLHHHGGARFRHAVDWVGIDVYPGTWGPAIDSTRLGPAAAAMTGQALHALRHRYMPLAGLPRQVAIHVSENGYPTGSARTPAMQEAVMRAAIITVAALRSRYHITDYRWFDLRDANSASANFEDHYGLLNDDYTPKPAFALYRRLIAQYSRR